MLRSNAVIKPPSIQVQETDLREVTRHSRGSSCCPCSIEPMPTERQILYRYDRTDPAKAYEQAQADALLLLGRLQRKIGQDMKDINDKWGQVGNLAHTIEELGDLADFLGA